MTSTQKRVDFNAKLGLFLTWARVNDIPVMIFSHYRTATEQRKLFDEGKSGCDGVKKISMHQRWLAVDIVLIDENGLPEWRHVPAYSRLGAEWESLGGTWGGAWALRDIYHFQVREGE